MLFLFSEFVEQCCLDCNAPPSLLNEALRCELTSPTIAKGNAMAPTRSPTNGRRQKLIVICECIVGECESPQFNRC